jgi:hypothetical protein
MNTNNNADLSVNNADIGVALSPPPSRRLADAEVLSP